jgi:XamI restriction endonuclease
MLINANKPERWKADIAQSVDLYNNWFLKFAPHVYRNTRVETTKQVETALSWTGNLTNISPAVLRHHPSILPMLRMSTMPPLARDRLIGLAGVTPYLVRSMEIHGQIPIQMSPEKVEEELQKIGQIVMRLIDHDIFPWLQIGQAPTDAELYRAATIVADRLCGAASDPIIRNAQEQRQFELIRQWLAQRGYTEVKTDERETFDKIEPGTFAFRLNIQVMQDSRRRVIIPVDAVVKPIESNPGDFPLLIEAKSAGDFTNTNKRRKEEATKLSQLRATYGNSIRFILFLCGYFDSGYLGYEAAEGIDWVWEHRIDDLTALGV